MKHSIDTLFNQLLEGNRVIANIHGDSLEADFYRMVWRLELKSHGVRFLPAQVVKRAVRKLKKAYITKSKGKS